MTIQVIYEKGILRPLSPLQISEGTLLEVELYPSNPATLAEIDAHLETAGVRVLVEVPEEARHLSIEERMALGALFATDVPLSALLDEDRGER